METQIPTSSAGRQDLWVPAVLQHFMQPDLPAELGPSVHSQQLWAAHREVIRFWKDWLVSLYLL